MPSTKDQKIKTFWSRVDTMSGLGPNKDCWEISGCLNKQGYPSWSVNGKKHNAHRASYILNIGDIEDKTLVVCHTCDNKRCVRPEHLFLGTQAQNIADKVLKSRQAKGEKVNTSKLRSEEVYNIRFGRRSSQSLKELSDYYGVSTYTIYEIINGLTWRHITSDFIPT